jgi:hypothetical protein
LKELKVDAENMLGQLKAKDVKKKRNTKMLSAGRC